MNRKSVSASVETKMLETLRTLVPSMKSVGLLEVADAGTAKEEDLTSLQVRAYNFVQPNDGMPTFTLSVEIRLNVEQSEGANGGMFFDAHEKVALWLERVMLHGRCDELDTDEAHVDGIQRMGDDKDFDNEIDGWYAVWDLTLSGRIRHK